MTESHGRCSLTLVAKMFSTVVLPSYIPKHVTVFPVGYGVREGEVQKKNETGTLQEQFSSVQLLSRV